MFNDDCDVSVKYMVLKIFSSVTASPLALFISLSFNIHHLTLQCHLIQSLEFSLDSQNEKFIFEHESAVSWCCTFNAWTHGDDATGAIATAVASAANK